MDKQDRELTAQEQAIHDNIDAKEALLQEAKENINDLFEVMDLDELLKDPDRYLKVFASLVQHMMAVHQAKAAEAGKLAAHRFAGTRDGQ